MSCTQCPVSLVSSSAAVADGPGERLFLDERCRTLYCDAMSVGCYCPWRIVVLGFRTKGR